MTKAAALYQFFSSFGVPAYEATSVPLVDGKPDVIMPYLTYTMPIGAFEDVTFPTVNLYAYGASNIWINAKTQEIMDRCHNGATIRFDGGGAIIYCDKWEPLSDAASDLIRRRYANFTIQWYSNT